MNIKLASLFGKVFVSFLMLQIGLQPYANGQTNASGSLVNLGPQVVERSINGSTFIKDSNGDQWVYTVERLASQVVGVPFKCNNTGG